MAQAVALQENETGGTSQEVLATFERPRLPWHPRLQETMGIDRLTWKTIIDTIFPGATSVDTVVTAINYCRSRGLDVMKRPVHIVSMYDAKQQKMVEKVWPGISELRTTAFRTKDYAGCDETKFGKMHTTVFEGELDVWEHGRKTDKTRKIKAEVTFPEWAQVTVYRMIQGQRVPFSGPKVYWSETYASVGKTDVPNDMWKERPIGQLEKCAEAAALRKAFPEEIGAESTAEEMAGRTIDNEIEGHGVVVSSGSAAPAPALALAPARAPDPEPPVAAETPKAEVGTDSPVSANQTPKAPDLPDFLDRRNEAKMPAPAPEPAPMEDDFPGDERSKHLQEEVMETAEDVIKEMSDHFATAKSEEEIDQFYTEGDFEARLEPFVGGVEKARSIRDEAKRRFVKPKADPFLIPDNFKDPQHVSEWADAAIAATVDHTTADKLRAIWAGSKARRAEVLTPETNKPIYDRVAAAVLKFTPPAEQPASTEAAPSDPTPDQAPVPVDVWDPAKNEEHYFVQAHAVCQWSDPEKIKVWMNTMAVTREELGIGQGDRWKTMKARLNDRMASLKQGQTQA